MYSTTTRGIQVTVSPFFLEDHSRPEENRFVWAYQVRIENHGSDTVRLLARHWILTDSAGRVQEVRGPGVVGEQPLLRPGERFDYTSGAPLAAPSGLMRGSYEMESEDGERFRIEIPAFSLDSPYERPNFN